MLLLVRLLRRYRVFVFFLLLELFALLLYYRSRNYGTGRIYQHVQGIFSHLHLLHFGLQQYFSLRTIHQQLLKENLRLRKQVAELQAKLPDTAPYLDVANTELSAYELVLVRVLRSSYIHTHNSITLNKGTTDGLRPGMGLLGPGGIAGRIKYVSAHFAVAYSLLDTDVLTSAQLGRDGTLCSVRWPAEGARYTRLEYLPRHIQPALGDTVYTSGYGGVYPAMLPIGIIDQIDLRVDETFYRIRLRLLTNFRALHYVYAVTLPRYSEQDSLQQLMQAP